ncbi:uncharacterized protein DSM5745_04456 [Aspergillus mulundensis]|uniref:chitinase n=1 Tax=Aspergillus mulundensis TaxID=1810919 RepID=A0A3D8SCQ6_9EURO|nr:Uncharacterized protein DSM5745_04456 [Aspergillus mulundensis]RDW84130.1 Uncharacterized protein DSM5745_04456 [Aspergillus mulundensis]
MQSRGWASRSSVASLFLVLLPIFLLSIYTTVLHGQGRVARRAYEPPSFEHLHHNVSQLLRRADLDPYSCTEDIPCQNGACCGSFFGGDVGTCGYGATYCGSDCVSNCDASAECGQTANPPGKTCPLNVCCSEYGFCGTTDEFCSPASGCQSNCGHPSVPAGKSSKSVEHRVIGYYEAWMARSSCHRFPPAAIPVDGLTHVNFAFAYIDPDTFEVTTMDDATPAELFTQTADVRSLKSGNGDLEVFISLGGWTFSDNNTATQPVFSDIASNEANRQRFADNLLDFMRHYGFDGVDIDWEYPGAGDRGGKKEDTENYVKLLKTLRATFDSSERGSYGLTFTIPSSYWYLRWFDVPGMLQYADWVNLMSYDLHGVWDEDNPIGNVLLAHTNLTEIKQSAELLWRNNVPPGKVVLGLGFYGRSFQVEDTSCTKPGCPFAGAANKGSCTDNAGTLAYFEIQDIIKEDKPDIVHDKDAAVNYIVFQEDQWVSFDDKKTFQQKMDWANEVGLGGVMIWSVDQDDDDFSALEGLLGRSIGSYKTLVAKSTVTDAGHWASINGQKCVMTDCEMFPKCPAGYELAPFPGTKSFKDTCSGDKTKVICCPVDAMPESCVWRGGESGRSCHGQCHAGEMTLFHSRHATTNCYRPGFQAACCKATAYTQLIDSCVNGNPYRKIHEWDVLCPTGYTQIAHKYKPDLYFWGKGLNIPICCPSESAFENCHWVGKGTCDDNECDDNDVEFMLDPFGEGHTRCALGQNGRKKVLCCNAPKNISPYLPVDLDKIFPTLPPKQDYPDFDLQNLGADSDPVVNEPNQQTFGLVVIDGPPGTVSNLQRRDSGGIEVLDCDAITESGISTVRVVCMSESSAECEIGDGVVNGTILRMPEGCGPGTYAVAHSMREAQNQALPPHIKRSLAVPPIVHDLNVSYDFSRVKRDAGDIYIRIDYSNTLDFWNEIVKADPVKKRDLNARFWSTSEDAWKNKLDELRRDEHPGQFTLSREDFRNTLVAAKGPDSCSEESFLDVKLGGTISEELKFGFSFVGTIAPTFNIEEAHGYFDSRIMYNGFAEVNARGAINIDGGMHNKPLWDSPISAYGFSHPGICSLRPELNIEARLSGTGYAMDGDFTARFVAGNDLRESSRLNQPSALGAASGGVTNSVPGSTFSGKLSTSKADARTGAKDKRDASTHGTVLAIALAARAAMNIEFYGFQSTLHVVPSSVVFSNEFAGYQVDLTGDLPGWEAIELTQIGDDGEINVLHPGGGDAPPANREVPSLNGLPLFDESGMVSCGVKPFEESCLDPQGLVVVDPTLLLDPDTGDPYSDEYGSMYATLKRSLEERAIGAARTFNPRDGNGGRFSMRSLTYYNGENGEALLRANPDAGRYAGADLYNCNDLSITDDSTDPTLFFVTEHGVELQYFPRVLEFLITGRVTDPDGTVYVASWADTNPTPSTFFDENSLFQQDYSTWDPGSGLTGSPMDRIWEAFGSTNHPERNVNTEATLNSYKERVWAGKALMTDAKWEEHGYNTWNRADSVARAAEALSVINQAFITFNYLNSGIQPIVAETFNIIADELTLYSERINTLFPGTDLPDLGNRQNEYLHNVLIARMERVEQWAELRLQTMVLVWTDALQNGHPEAQSILDSINDNLAALGRESSFVVNTTNFPIWRPEAGDGLDDDDMVTDD